MIYIASTYTTMLTVIRRCSLPLLAVPLCLLLSSCDTASSNSDQDMIAKLQSTDTRTNTEPQHIAPDLQNNLISEIAANDTADESTEAQSLIAVAQSSHDGQTTPSIPNAESSNSALQATLMGDYGGMVPCADCDRIDVMLNLFSDGSVTKSSIYQNPIQPRLPLIESGVYRQDQDKITIAYEGGRIESYHIRDNHLVLEGMQNTPNDDYILSRQ